ncbi:DUF3822 family protein [Tellurirhabdus rosea]|uniref:DUF3822 family protein n=1 Tax=Tellurirhabdus rosea TaxID=2674997 RepID=UPI002253F34B|nr:DUF3822 family protein [Tellurirhabdus rosea]
MTPTVAVRSETVSARLTDKGVLGTAQTSPYQLCLEMGKDRFRFCIVEPAARKEDRAICHWLEDYTFPTLVTDYPLLPALKTLQEEHAVFQNHDWKQVIVSLNTPTFTLVPSVLFRKEYASHYLQMTRGSALPATEQTHTYAHQDEGFHSIFNLEIRLQDWLAAAFPLQQLTILHQTSTVLHASKGRKSGGYELILYFEEEYVTLVAREAGALKFCNKFGYKNTSDLVYYILFVISELKRQPAEMEVVLYGEITPFADSYTLMARFLPRLSFGLPPDALAFTGDFDELPEHRYASLFSLGLL